MDAAAGMDVDPKPFGRDAGAAAAAAGTMPQQTAADVSSGDVFMVCLNRNVVASNGNVEALQRDVEALQREFADWFPGPVLFETGTKVKLKPKEKLVAGEPKSGLLFEEFDGRVGTVAEHLASDPRIVAVHLPLDGKKDDTEAMTDNTEVKTVQVLHSILQLEGELKARKDEPSAEMLLVEQLLSASPAAGAGARYTAIGYNEFQCGDKAEREFWLCLNPSAEPLHIAAGQIPMHCIEDQSRRHRFCVMHLQYSGPDPAASTVQRAAVRVTKTIELRAHQDKCRPCEVCTRRAKPSRGRAYGCAYCTEFKWQDAYGEQYRGDFCAKIESLCARQDIAHACTKQLPLNDACQRRFALVVGNSEYLGNPRSNFSPLKGAVEDAQKVAHQLKQFGFSVCLLENQTKEELERAVTGWTRTLPENAHALVYLNGHGMELEGERYFVPKNYGTHGTSIVATAKDECVTLGWIFERIYSVLLQDGLIMAFWDCCRQDELKAAEQAHVVRSGHDTLIRGMAQLKKKLEQKHYPLASWVCVYASAPASLAFEDDRDGGFLTRSLLEWWRNSELACLSIGDDKVRDFVTKKVEEAKTGQQRPVWESCGSASFSFKAGSQDESQQQTGSMAGVENIVPPHFPGAPSPAGKDRARPKAGAASYNADGCAMITTDRLRDDDVQQLLQFLANSNWHGDAALEETGAPEQDAKGAALRKVSAGYFDRFCKRVERTLADRELGKVEPICIVDFPFRDTGGLNLEESAQLLERAYCFIDRHDAEEAERLVVLHAHTMCKWIEAKNTPAHDRVKKITSVNVRHANKLERCGLYKQEYGGESLSVLPVSRELWNGWRDKFRAKRSSELEWSWRDGASFPQGEDRQGSHEAYLRMRKVIRLGESLFDNYSAHQVWTESTQGPYEFNKIITIFADDVAAEAAGSRGTAEGASAAADPRRSAVSRGQVVAVSRKKVVEPAAGGLGVVAPPHAVAEWAEPNWADLQLGKPDAAPWPFKILFVGVNSNEKLDLNLKREFEKIQAALDKVFKRASNDRPVLKQIAYSTWNEVMNEIMDERPTWLHFGCHSEKGTGMHLYENTVQPETMLPAIQHWNEFARQNRWEHIRVLVLNACDSNVHAKKLNECVDFVIGHEKPVKDEGAIDFSGTLYRCIFDGMNLSGSFITAKSVSSPGYRIYAKKDPREFYLLQSGPHQGYKRTFESNESEAGAGAKRANTKFESDDSEVGSAAKFKMQRSDSGGESGSQSDMPEAGDASKMARADIDSRLSKAAGKRLLDTSESSSTDGKKAKQDSASASVQGSSLVGGAVASVRQGRDADRLSAVSTTSDRDCNELVRFLTGKGLKAIALRFSEVMGGMELKEDFETLRKEDLDDPDLSFLKRWQKEKLLRLATGITARACTRGLNDSELSGDDTSSDSERDDRTEYILDAVLAKHPGSPAEFQAHISGFLKSMLGSAPETATETFHVPFEGHSHELSYCMLVWMRFAKEACPEGLLRDKWLDCIKTATQDRLLAMLETCLQQGSTCHMCWIRADFKKLNCTKPYAAAIFVTDEMVQHSLRGHAESVLKWQQDVVEDWFQNGEAASAFLFRANFFLRQHMLNGTSVVNQVVEIQSYVAFMSMTRLASLLLFEYLEARKLHEASAPGAAGSSSSLFQGFRMFVSSSNGVFSLTEADEPARRLLPTVLRGVRCLSRLSPTAWEMMGEVKTANDICHAQAAFLGPKMDQEVGKGKAQREMQRVWHAQRIGDDETSAQATRPLNSQAESQRESGRTSRHEPRTRPTMKPQKTDKAADETLKAGIRTLEKVRESVYTNRITEIFYRDSAARESIQRYLQQLVQQDTAQKDRLSVGSYIDSASGEVRRVDGGCVALELLANRSFLDECNKCEDAVMKDLRCPISGGLLQNPVTCSDGHTYERAFIVQQFRQAEIAFEDQNRSADAKKNFEFVSPKSPMTKPLEFRLKAGSDRRELKFNEEIGEEIRVRNEAICDKIRQFKDRKLVELNSVKQNAEGKEEKRILRSRHGCDSQADDSLETVGTIFDSAKEFFDWIVARSQAGLACLTGPPASGKTVTMQQFVFAAVQECRAKMETDGSEPLLPVFMRAAVLSQLISKCDRLSGTNCEPEHLLREVVAEFLNHGIEQGIFEEDAKTVILDLYDYGRVFICIDGLDEAAAQQEMLEVCIEHAVRSAQQSQRRLHVLLSTREHSYVHSRACLRLGDFDVVNLQPLNEARQQQMIQGRIPSGEVNTFREQLDAIAGKNPELATSPFLLNLMIEVYRKEGEIPSRRVDLYEKQVEAIVNRCIQARLKDQGASGSLVAKTILNEKLLIATRFLETLAFVCQMRKAARDFKLDECASEVSELWQDGEAARTEAQQLLFTPQGKPLVGLLADVGDGSCRFSHLTLQEYLAARCAVRLYAGAGARKILDQFGQGDALFSRWKREVLQFTACTLPEEMFPEFCQALLETDDGTGACCELVQDFLNERGASEVSSEVEGMMRDRMQHNRGVDLLLAGLCHPCPEMRSLVLSEMKQFRVPLNPFADGTVSKLKEIAEEASSVWHRRAAAMLSIAQIAQMKHCSVSDRTATIQWTLKMLQSEADVLENVYFAVVKALGTMLGGNSNPGDGLLLKSSEDERAILQPDLRDSSVVASAFSDLKIFSEALVDWLQGEPCRIAWGRWSIRHIHFMCKKLVEFKDLDRSSRMAQSLFIRLHSSSFAAKDRDSLLECLKLVHGLLESSMPTQVLPFLESGDMVQRTRVLQVCAELNLRFRGQVLNELVRCLRLGVVSTSGDVASGASFLEYLVKNEGSVNQSMQASCGHTSCVAFLKENVESGNISGDITLKQLLGEMQVFEKFLGSARALESKSHDRHVVPDAQKPELHQQVGLVVSDAFEKKGEKNAAVPRNPEIQQWIISVEALKGVVQRFTPETWRSTADEKSYKLVRYCSVSLWSDSDLMMTTKDQAKTIRRGLKLSSMEQQEAENVLGALKALKHPWFEGCGKKDGAWERKIMGALQTGVLGRFIFGMILSRVRERHRERIERATESAADDLAALEREILEHEASARGQSDHVQQLECKFLLKELCIGRRLQELPTWTGAVTLVKGRQGCLHLSHMYGPAAPGRQEAYGLYPDLNHFEPDTCPCQGQTSDGKPCTQKGMLQCRFCPFTKLPQLNGGEFAAWSNPIASNGSPGDMARNARGHVDGRRGWHQFWYAVHSLYPQMAGGAAAGGGAAGGAAGGGGLPGDPQLMMEWFAKKAPDYAISRGDFERAGLLEPGGEGATYGIIDKFSMADQLFQAFPHVLEPAKKRRGQSTITPHTPDIPAPDDEGRPAKRGVKLEVHSAPPAPAGSASEQIAPALPLPEGGGDGTGFVSAYNISEEDPVVLEGLLEYDSLHSDWEPFQEDPQQGSSSGAAGGSGLGLFVHHRPVFNVFLDAMTGVAFQTEQARDEWIGFDVDQDFQRSMEFGLAQVIGRYLHAGELSSPVLGSFYQALQAPDPAGLLPYFQQLQGVALDASTMPAVTASLAAIYCYWRIEQELLHPMYASQLAVWQGSSIRGRLLQILYQLQQGADPASQKPDLIRFFAEADREILLRLRECGDSLRYYCSNTGSFAQVVRAPRIWCFFLTLRLRHEEDFARALWDKGFRFVAAHLDPLRDAPDRDAWIAEATGLLTGSSPGAGAGGGGGGLAGILRRPKSSRDPQKLVAQLLAAEGKEVDQAARAEEEDGEDVGLPPVSERKSLTAARMRLVSQGLSILDPSSWNHYPTSPPTPEFKLIFDQLNTCRHSDAQAREALDKETYDMIFKTSAVRAKGAAREATRSAGGGGAMRGGGGAAGRGGTSKDDEDKAKAEETLEDLHDFRDATGFSTSDWVLQVTVKQHDGKEDTIGERIAISETEKAQIYRRYKVDAGKSIKVTLKNLSLTKDIKLLPVYVSDTGEEEPEDLVDLKCKGEEYELPYPLQKDEGEEEDAWAIKDSNGRTVLKLRFKVK